MAGALTCTGELVEDVSALCSLDPGAVRDVWLIFMLLVRPGIGLGLIFLSPLVAGSPSAFSFALVWGLDMPLTPSLDAALFWPLGSPLEGRWILGRGAAPLSPPMESRTLLKKLIIVVCRHGDLCCSL